MVFPTGEEISRLLKKAFSHLPEALPHSSNHGSIGLLHAQWRFCLRELCCPGQHDQNLQNVWVLCLCWDLSGSESFLRLKVSHTFSEHGWRLPPVCLILTEHVYYCPYTKSCLLVDKVFRSLSLISHQGQNPLGQKLKSLSQPAKIKS